MSTLREAAQDALTAYETFRDVDDIDGLDDAIDRLRAALAEPKTELRDQHKAFAEWFLQQNPIAPNVEDMAWAAWKAALAQPEADGWTPASEPPDSARLVIAWCLGRAHVALHMPDTDPHWYQCPSPDNEDWYDLNAVTHWRDAQPPTEAPAQCQRGESDGRPCGLTPPCPDCGPSLIDVAEDA